MDGFRNRIKEVRTVSAEELRVNEANWRRHPDRQVKALHGLLTDVGVVAPLVAYHSERAGGALTLIDGHLRHGVGGEWPCVILDVTDDEADIVLATFDPIGGLADIDARALTSLLDSVDMTALGEELSEFLDDLTSETHLIGKPPSLDDLAAEHGEPSERDFWPILRIQIAPQTMERYTALMDGIPGDDEAEKFRILIESVVLS